jgi:hypothetical protein
MALEGKALRRFQAQELERMPVQVPTQTQRSSRVAFAIPRRKRTSKA